MSGLKPVWNGRDPKAMHRMKKLFELEKMMVIKQQARDSLGLYPMRLLREDIERRRTAKERERGWTNSYKGNPQPRIPVPFGYMDHQLVLTDKVVGLGRDNAQTFLASLANSKGQNDVKMQGRERGWTNSTYKEPRVNETLYGLSKPNPYGQQQTQHNYNNSDSKVLQRKKLEHARQLETGWVSVGREQGKGRTGSGGTLGRPRGLTSSELQTLQKAKAGKLERATTTRGATERSTGKRSGTNFRSGGSADWQDQKEKYDHRLVVPIGTLERSGFGSASNRASITADGQRDKHNQLLDTLQQLRTSESGKEKSRSTDEDVLKKGIEKEEQAGWMSSYKRNQKREMYGLAKQRDKTASEVLKENYEKYREVGWINSLHRQKPGA